MVFMIVVLAVSLVCGVFCHRIARRREANAVFWAVMGVSFGPFAIPFVYLSRSVTDRRKKRDVHLQS